MMYRYFCAYKNGNSYGEWDTIASDFDNFYSQFRKKARELGLELLIVYIYREHIEPEVHNEKQMD